MPPLNETHAADRKSWIDSANTPDTDFPIQNLPYGVYSTPDQPRARTGVAIGDQILDLAMIESAGLLPTSPHTSSPPLFTAPSLNAFMACGPDVWSATRRAISDLLAAGAVRLRDDHDLRSRALSNITGATLHLPFTVSEYTDFYASREHATNVGTMFRDPDNALTPNWLHMPIGYNGRASSVIVSGTDIHRPLGQIKAADAAAPSFAPTAKLDMELEMGAVVGTPSPHGQPLTMADAEAMIFGYVLLNDWSARDFQVWEYQPLGPFQAKAFATTISPWVVTQEALAPFRAAGPDQDDPAPLPYLRHGGLRNYDINLNIAMQPAAAAGSVISRTNFKYMYWSSAQQLAHHAVSGCAMRTGDLLGSGTISGPARDSCGSLLELTWNGRDTLNLIDGIGRTFIEDGDTISLTGWCQGEGYRVGFGEARGKILPPVSFTPSPFTPA